MTVADPSVSVRVPERMSKEAERLLSAPTDDRARRFAEALATEAGEAVRVEVWRPTFDADELVVDAELIASGTATGSWWRILL